VIRYLKPGEAVPTVTPLRYTTVRGYASLRWKVGPDQYVECYEHRVIDGHVTTAEHVHHVNHVRTDNRPENLRHVTAAEHHDEHPSVYAEECVRLYAEGRNTTEIAKRLSINPATVYRLLKARGVAFRDRNERRRVSVDEARLRELHQQGLSTLQIAKALGHERTVVRRLMKALGLPANGRTYG
jgi:HNH endonuclease/Homeodomain-like domain